MKKIIFNKLAIGILLIIGSSSCSEDFLTEVNPNELSTASFWKNNTDLNLGLTAVYNAFKNQDILNIAADNNRSDLNWPGWRRPNPTNRFMPYYLHTFNDSNDDIANKWTQLYVTIFRANQVIENGNRLLATYTDQGRIDFATQIIAQARFFRGLSYSYLYNMFNQGSVIIFDFVPTGENQFNQPLSPATDVKAFYLADFEFAYENLPPIWDTNTNLGRVTSAAAAAELGRSYLYEEDYDKAAEYFADIITNSAYQRSLVANIDDNFSEAGEFNSESILEISYSTFFKSELTAGDLQNVSNNHARTFAPGGSLGGFRVVQPSSWIQMAYKEDQMDVNDSRNLVPCEAGDTDCNPVTLMRPRSFSLRASYSVAFVDDIDTPYYAGELPGDIAQFNNNETGYYRKYTNWATLGSENENNPTNRSPINVRLVRLADVYLMMAECLIKGGTDDSGVDTAMALINAVRYRSALQLVGPNGSGAYPGSSHDNVSYSAQSLMEHLMYIERPLELAEEGHAVRFLDLRRWGVLKQRFEDLASRNYWADLFTVTNLTTGNPQNRRAVLVEGSTPTTPANLFSFKDFEQAAVNYNESLHAYYPIPARELSANPNLNN